VTLIFTKLYVKCIRTIRKMVNRISFTRWNKRSNKNFWG